MYVDVAVIVFSRASDRLNVVLVKMDGLCASWLATGIWGSTARILFDDVGIVRDD